MSAPRFVYATCNAGSEAHLKHDVARDLPALRFALSRPGLVTFKTDTDIARLPSPFARVSGQSIGAFRDAEAVADAIASHDFGARRFALHVFEREPSEHFARPTIVGDAEETVRAAIGRRGLTVDEHARDGGHIVDVIVAPSEPLFVGTRVHDSRDSSSIGGLPRIDVPPDAPSRAFAKIEEALEWSLLPIRSGDHVLELGCAPGGVSDALVRRGARVLGIDPGAMDEEFLARAKDRFVHVREPMGAVDRARLPPGIKWLVMDVNLAPQVALRSVQKFVAAYRAKTLEGAVLTLKMNDDQAIAAVPALLERTRGLGFREVRARQLPSNRREITVVARM